MPRRGLKLSKLHNSFRPHPAVASGQGNCTIDPSLRLVQHFHLARKLRYLVPLQLHLTIDASPETQKKMTTPCVLRDVGCGVFLHTREEARHVVHLTTLLLELAGRMAAVAV